MFLRKGKFVILHGIKAWLHSLLTSALGVDENSATHLCRFNHGNPLSSSLGGPRRRSGTLGEDKTLLLLSGIESREFHPLAESLRIFPHHFYCMGLNTEC